MRQFWTSTWCGVSWFDNLVRPYLKLLPTLLWAGNFTPLLTKILLRTVMTKNWSYVLRLDTLPNTNTIITVKCFSWDTISQDLDTTSTIIIQVPSNTIFEQLSRDYTIPYLVPGVTFCENQVHHEKVVTQEFSDHSLLK